MVETPAVREPTIDTSASFINVSYYFSLPIGREGRFIDAMDQSSWPLRERVSTIWIRDRANFDEFLEHLVEWAQPDEAASRREPRSKDDHAHFWRMNRDVLQSRRGLACGRGYRWHCTIGRVRQVPFEISNVSASIFTAGVGIITLHITSSSRVAADWFDLGHYLRFSEAQRSVEVTVESTSTDGAGFLDGLQWTATTPGAHYIEGSTAPVSRHLGHLINRVLRASFGSEDDLQWQPIGACIKGQLVPYCVFFLDGVPESVIPEYLYRFQDFLRLDQVVALPQSTAPGRMSRGTYEYSRGLHFTFSVDGGGFLACDAPEAEFFRTTLPDHLNGPYFLAFVFAYYQRAVLLRLSAMIARSWGSGAASRAPADVLAGFKDVQLVLFAFTARGHFGQVMQRHHHQEIYEQWRQALKIEGLYNEVNLELEQLVQYLNTRRNDRIEHGQRMLNQLVFSFGLPSLYLAYLQVTKMQMSDTMIALGILGFAMVGVAVAKGVEWRIRSRW